MYTYAIYTSRWYVRNYVRLVCQGGDHWKKVLFRGCELDDVFPKISMFPTFRSLFLGLQDRIFGQREKPICCGTKESLVYLIFQPHFWQLNGYFPFLEGSAWLFHQHYPKNAWRCHNWSLVCALFQVAIFCWWSNWLQWPEAGWQLPCRRGFAISAEGSVFHIRCLTTERVAKRRRA